MESPITMFVLLLIGSYLFLHILYWILRTM